MQNPVGAVDAGAVHLMCMALAALRLGSAMASRVAFAPYSVDKFVWFCLAFASRGWAQVIARRISVTARLLVVFPTYSSSLVCRRGCLLQAPAQRFDAVP